jgi:tRNA threonylcarbamoyladenosine biosynthesis protein TsaB
MKEDTFIINIHTTDETAMVVLSKEDKILGCVLNYEFKEHAKFLHPAINQLLEENNISPSLLRAVSVTHGPGSYTGIRVGLAAAKGLFYALKIPLITLNTLDVLAKSAIQKVKEPFNLYCPMIDARRMEVYTAIYNFDLIKVMEPQPIILNSSSIEQFIDSKKVYLFGSGSYKFKELIEQEKSNYLFLDMDVQPAAITALSYKNFSLNKFSDLAYSEPEYLKDFIITTIK